MIGLVLGWKFNHAPGIETRDGVITAWPDSLGPLPTADQIATWTAEYEARVEVPDTVTPLQARRALRAAGLLDTVNAWVAQQDDEDIKDAWEFASVIERHGPITAGAARELGLTNAQLDGLFIAAAAF
ncbi:MAG: hypothetical protein ACK4NA_12880 [Alphaproteobacteria bacterium]